jgi:adenosylhomocysteinase
MSEQQGRGAGRGTDAAPPRDREVAKRGGAFAAAGNGRAEVADGAGTPELPSDFVLSDVADPGLAAAGLARIGWAERAMPVLGMIRDRFERQRPFAGLVVAACLHVTAETAVLVNLVTAGGGRLHLAASNPLSTQDDIAAALAACPGVTVHARAGVDRDTYYEHIHRVLDAAPGMVIDDGCDLVNTLHTERPELLAGVRGGCESTTTGVARLRRMAAEGTLAFPMVAADDSRTRRMFDNFCGTGQSVIDGILRATNTLLAGKVVVVAGYGPCGSGIADRAKGLGAQVIVTEVDPVRALEALMRGFRVMPMTAAAALGQVFVTATGSRDVIGPEHMAVMRDGAILANAGHFDVEVDVRGLAGLSVAVHPAVRPHADEYLLADGRRLILLAEGRVVNLVAAEGNPAAVMDVSFGVQALALAWLATTPGDGQAAGTEGLPPGVHEVPAEIDAQVAALALASLGAEIDALSTVQRDYLESWRQGSLSRRPCPGQEDHQAPAAHQDRPVAEQPVGQHGGERRGGAHARRRQCRRQRGLHQREPARGQSRAGHGRAGGIDQEQSVPGDRMTGGPDRAGQGGAVAEPVHDR